MDVIVITVVAGQSRLCLSKANVVLMGKSMRHAEAKVSLKEITFTNKTT